ncbi:hypothetical protein ACOME3_007979 [Neoechinorhynchus agilis]
MSICCKYYSLSDISIIMTESEILPLQKTDLCLVYLGNDYDYRNLIRSINTINSYSIEAVTLIGQFDGHYDIVRQLREMGCFVIDKDMDDGEDDWLKAQSGISFTKGKCDWISTLIMHSSLLFSLINGNLKTMNSRKMS